MSARIAEIVASISAGIPSAIVTRPATSSRRAACSLIASCMAAGSFTSAVAALARRSAATFRISAASPREAIVAGSGRSNGSGAAIPPAASSAVAFARSAATVASASRMAARAVSSAFATSASMCATIRARSASPAAIAASISALTVGPSGAGSAAASFSSAKSRL